jgi:heme-degrading monooxygenase HmoA
MVTEIAIFKIDPKKASEFEKMAAEISPKTLRKQKGYISDRLLHAIERPEEYILAVEWESVEAHQKFIDSKDYALMSGPFGNFVIESTFAHYK